MEDDSDSFESKILEFVKHNFIVVGLLVVGIIFIGVGISQMMGHREASVKFQKGAQVEAASTTSNKLTSKITIDVEGQVQNPGVYTLNSEARIQDALVAAGGLSSQADRNALNLAQRISDGQKIYVPAVGEVSNQTTGGSSSIISESGSSVGGMISVNSADQASLESLPGIGQVTAGKIISNRPYGSLEELVSKKALGQKTFDKIRSQISL